MSIAPNPVDPRVRRTRQLLVDAFTALLQQRTFDAITVQDIAERATVNRATFYAHFEDKYALLDYVIHEFFQQALDHRLPTPPKCTQVDALYALAAVGIEMLSSLDGHCSPTDQHAKPLYALKLQRELFQKLLSWLEQWQIGQPATRQTVATVMSWAIMGAADQRNQEQDQAPVEQAARQVVDVLLAGVARALDLALSA